MVDFSAKSAGCICNVLVLRTRFIAACKWPHKFLQYLNEDKLLQMQLIDYEGIMDRRSMVANILPVVKVYLWWKFICGEGLHVVMILPVVKVITFHRYLVEMIIWACKTRVNSQVNAYKHCAAIMHFVKNSEEGKRERRKCSEYGWILQTVYEQFVGISGSEERCSEEELGPLCK